MAISAVNKASVASGTNAASYATGSYTPTANRLMICVVQTEISGVPNVPTVTGNGLTWTQIASYQDDTSGTQSRITLFAALSGSSPSTGAVTADLGGQTQAGGIVIVDEYDGADISGTAAAAIVQTKNGTVNGSGLSESITLTSAITSGNASAGAFHHQAAEVTTFGSGYTELGDVNHASPSSALQTEYKATGATVVNASWATSIGKGGMAWEVKAAASGTDLVIANGAHSHAAGNVSLTQVHSLVVANGGHAHAAGNVVLSQVHFISVQSGSHAHAAGNVTLTVELNLAINNGGHAHTAENVVLTQAHSLSVQGGSHAHTAENATLTQVHNLAAANGSHDHAAANVTLTQVHNLTLANGSHAHVAENVTLGTGTPATDLVIQNGSNAHSASNVTLTQVHNLNVDNGSHAHVAGNAALSQVHNVSIANAGHAHISGNVTLTQVHNLAIQSAAHTHIAGNVTLDISPVFLILIELAAEQLMTFTGGVDLARSFTGAPDLARSHAASVSRDSRHAANVERDNTYDATVEVEK